MQSSHDFQRLTTACSQEGCILCRLTGESMHRYLETWKDELFTDVSIREELRHSKGFCHEHTWQLVDMGAAISLAQAYRDILSDSMEQLEHDNGTRKRPWFTAKAEATLCPACQQQAQIEARLVSSLREAVTEPSFYAKFSASSGLCLSHFQLTCELKPLSVPAAMWLPLLRQAQLLCLQRLDAQLGELIRKHDYRFKDEAHGHEMLSWKNAAGLVAGEDQRA